VLPVRRLIVNPASWIAQFCPWGSCRASSCRWPRRRFFYTSIRSSAASDAGGAARPRCLTSGATDQDPRVRLRRTAGPDQEGRDAEPAQSRRRRDRRPGVAMAVWTSSRAGHAGGRWVGLFRILGRPAAVHGRPCCGSISGIRQQRLRLAAIRSAALFPSLSRYSTSSTVHPPPIPAAHNAWTVCWSVSGDRSHRRQKASRALSECTMRITNTASQGPWSARPDGGASGTGSAAEVSGRRKLPGSCAGLMSADDYGPWAAGSAAPTRRHRCRSPSPNLGLRRESRSGMSW